MYSFFIPLNIPVQPTDQTVRLTVYDDSYYVAFDLLHLDDVTVKRDRRSLVCSPSRRRR